MKMEHRGSHAIAWTVERALKSRLLAEYIRSSSSLPRPPRLDHKEVPPAPNHPPHLGGTRSSATKRHERKRNYEHATIFSHHLISVFQTSNATSSEQSSNGAGYFGILSIFGKSYDLYLREGYQWHARRQGNEIDLLFRTEFIFQLLTFGLVDQSNSNDSLSMDVSTLPRQSLAFRCEVVWRAVQ